MTGPVQEPFDHDSTGWRTAGPVLSTKTANCHVGWSVIESMRILADGPSVSKPVGMPHRTSVCPTPGGSCRRVGCWTAPSSRTRLLCNRLWTVDEDAGLGRPGTESCRSPRPQEWMELSSSPSTRHVSNEAPSSVHSPPGRAWPIRDSGLVLSRGLRFTRRSLRV